MRRGGIQRITIAMYFWHRDPAIGAHLHRV